MRSALRLLCLVLLPAFLPSLRAQTASTGTPIRVAVVGLVHGHVGGFLNGFAKNTNPNVQLVAIEEPDTALTKKYVERLHLHRRLVRVFPAERQKRSDAWTACVGENNHVARLPGTIQSLQGFDSGQAGCFNGQVRRLCQEVIRR